MQGENGDMIAFKEFRKQAGYDLVGVPPMECFDGLASNEHPLSIFPDGKSVVVLGTRILRGKFRSIEEGSLWWGSPGRWLTEFDNVIRLIESHGYECIPYTPLDALKMPNRPVREGLCRPNGVRLSVEYAAVAAGLGELGYHGIFMTKEFGIRQMLGMLVTDMPIETGPAEKSEGICDSCMDCVRMCPLQAISEEDSVAITYNDREAKIGVINANACHACPNGACGDSKFFAGAEELHHDLENNQIKGDAKSSFALGGLPNRLAAACGRACIAHFEATHDTGYKIPYRIREPWGFRPDEERGW